ncbi:anti-anti-sigma factor [Nonomuraea thailandensis]|uniref:Anti-sigma factor antagonist n=1 Tax=Nonomuraea thailandensis TaxID=1188745 RepID=A0A9X2GPP8_9ACTN|nr:STAS domain-containing protein [Nonomuraea thailandensis]MCP2358533.1 anti-anti-sigma factor [Nonomuraea thailandensis]
MSPLSLSCRDVPGGALITVTGELDSTNADQLESYAERHRLPGPGLVLDLTGLTFMDSRGLHVLLRLNAAVRGQGGLLRLAAVHDVPARVLQITGVWLALHIHPDAQHAAAAMHEHQADGVRDRQ